MDGFPFFDPMFGVVFFMIFAFVVVFWIIFIVRMIRGRGELQMHVGPGNSSVVKEKEIIREIVKIRCSYCGNLYDETLDKCPHCGAKNA
jgi:hypothetical protein